MTSRTFTATGHDPVTLRLPSGSARVIVDPGRKLAEITLHTDDETGAAADAIRDARVMTVGGLEVAVPDAGGGGMTVINHGRGSISVSGNNYGTVISGGGNITVNGQRITPGMTGINVISPIAASVHVPPGTHFRFHSTSADLTVTGPLDALTVSTTSGDVEAGMVGALVANSVSGDVEATAVTGSAVVGSTSGDIEIGAYSGRHAALNAISGDIGLSATPDSSGNLHATTVSGDIRLRGAGHLNVSSNSVSGKVRR